MTINTKQPRRKTLETLTVDVRGLPDEKIRELELLIEQWKQADLVAATGQKTDDSKAEQEIVFATHNSKVNGPITRDEIYAHLG